MRRWTVTLASALLALAFAAPAAFAQRQSRQSRSAARAGAAGLQGQVRHQQGRVRGRGAPRLGAERRRPLLQPGEERLLRQRPLLPRHLRLHGAVRHQRRSEVSAPWREARIADDPVKQSNKRGYITYAMAGPNTRTTQVFINFGDNTGLDSQGFSPFGRIVTGMDVVDKLNAEYGEGAPRGRGPDQGRIQSRRQRLPDARLRQARLREESHDREITMRRGVFLRCDDAGCGDAAGRRS